MRFEYPLKIKVDKNKDDSPEDIKAAKAVSYYGHNNNFGFYPIGRLNSWHGGIHIEKDAPITAIAGGHVIAYRMPEQYRTENQNTANKYSNGFMLIQHTYTSKKGQNLRFYSLYNHLAPQKDLEDKHSAHIPDFLARYEAVIKTKGEAYGIIARSGTELEPLPNTKGIKKPKTKPQKGKNILFIPFGAIVTLDELTTNDITLKKYVINDIYSNKTSQQHHGTEQQRINEEIKDDQKKRAILESHWSYNEAFLYKNKRQYKRYKYTDPITKVTHTNIYIHKVALTSIGNKQSKVGAIDTEGMLRSSVDKGVCLFDKPNGTFKKVLTDQTTISVIPSKTKGWYQIQGQELFFQTTAYYTLIKSKKKVSNAIQVKRLLQPDKVATDNTTVTNVAIPIKAGQTIGYSGNYGFEKNNTYRAVHVEVFTDDTEVSNFFDNLKKDDDRSQYFVKPNQTLKVAKPESSLKKGTKVKVYQRKGAYVQIGFENFDAVIPHKDILWIKDRDDDKLNQKKYSDKNGYSILDQTALNKHINNAYQEGKAILKYAGHATLQKKNDARKIKFIHKHATKKYWVDAQALPPPSTGVITPVSTLQAQPIKPTTATINTDATATAVTETTTAPSLVTTTPEKIWLALTQDITQIYEQEPNAAIKNFKTPTQLRVSKKISQTDDKKWWKVRVTGKDQNGKQITGQGWIQYSPEAFITKNPYKWSDFGWQLEKDTGGNKYFYKFEKNNAHPFITKIWDMIDQPTKTTNAQGKKTKDNVLSLRELQRAMQDEGKVDILSKLICKHRNEWDYNQYYTELENEAIEIYQKGIDQEDYPDEKQHLIQARDQRLATIKDKIEHLCFWQKITPGAITTTTTPQPTTTNTGVSAGAKAKFGHITPAVPVSSDTETFKRQFPKDNSMVWHFHPIAFVEHMKLISAPKYDPDHGDFHDPLVNPQVRGWYGSTGHNPNSDIAYWNPYGSMKSHGDVGHLLSEEVKVYGKNQRGGNTHNGLDMYAPVGTPIYACVDGTIEMHQITKGSSGFKIKLVGQYKEERIRFNYIHLMQFEETRFRFYNKKNRKVVANHGWLNYNDFLTPKEWKDPDTIIKDPKTGKQETFTIHYSNGILKIDQNEIDVDVALNIKNLIDKKDTKVEKGQIIGYTGSTGNSYQGKRANHLHFNTYIKGEGVQPYEQFKEYFTLDIEGNETSKKQDGVTSSSKW